MTIIVLGYNWLDGSECLSVDQGRAWLPFNFTEIRVYFQKLNLSKYSRIEFRCGRRRMELPNPREFASYHGTKVYL